MGLFKRVKNIKKQQQTISYMNQLINQLSQYSGGSLGASNKVAVNRIFGRSPWYRTLVSKRATDISCIELELYKRKGEGWQPVESDPILTLVNGVWNEDMVDLQARKLLQIWDDNVGEWLIWKARNIAGVVIALYPLNPDKIMKKGSKTEKWEISTENGVRFIDNEDIIYYKDINPNCEYGRGTGQGQSASDELSISEKIMKLLGVTFDNKAIPPLIVTFKGVGETEVENAQQNWLNKLQGISNFGKMLFTNADIGINKVGMSFEETKIIELKKDSKDTFRQMFGIPSELLGDLGNSNRASSINAWNIYADNVLIPKIKMFCKIMNLYLIKTEFGEEYELRYKSPNKWDDEFKLKVMAQNPAAFTTDEYRVLANHDPWRESRGEEVLMPLNFTTRFQNNTLNNLQDEEQVGKIKLALKKKINKQDEIEIEEEELNQDDLFLLLLFIKDKIDVLLGISIFSSLYLDLISKISKDSFKELGFVDGVLNLNSSNVFNYTNSILMNTFNDIKNTLNDKINGYIKEGIIGNKSSNEIIEDLNKEVFESYKTGSKLKQISNTEGNSLFNFARLETAIQTSPLIQKEWITQRDNKVRESHLIDGQRRLLNNLFTLTDGVFARYPGDPDLPAEDRINERCSLGYVVDDKSLAGDTEEERNAYWNNLDVEKNKYNRFIGNLLIRQIQEIQIDVSKEIRNILK